MKQTLVNNFPNKLIDQQIKLYLHNIHRNSNNNNSNNTNRISLYYKNQMHKNYKLDEQVISNIIHTLNHQNSKTNKTHYLHKI